MTAPNMHTRACGGGGRAARLQRCIQRGRRPQAGSIALRAPDGGPRALTAWGGGEAAAARLPQLVGLLAGDGGGLWKRMRALVTQLRPRVSKEPVWQAGMQRNRRQRGRKLSDATGQADDPCPHAACCKLGPAMQQLPLSIVPFHTRPVARRQQRCIVAAATQRNCCRAKHMWCAAHQWQRDKPGSASEEAVRLGRSILLGACNVFSCTWVHCSDQCVVLEGGACSRSMRAC